MSSDRHLDFKQRIDRRLAGEGTLEEERLVEEHVTACAACREYLEGSRRAIAGLKGFSFEAGPGSHARVMAALRMRAEQRRERRAAARRWVGLSGAAVVLTLAGSVVDLRVGHLAARLLDLRAAEVRQGLLALWIAPSFGLLLLFPLLPLLAAKRYGKGETL